MVPTPSNTKPVIMIHACFASNAASALMSSCQKLYSSWTRPPMSQAIVKAIGPATATRPSHTLRLVLMSET
jgi:hypothetical protein